MGLGRDELFLMVCDHQHFLLVCVDPEITAFSAIIRKINHIIYAIQFALNS